MRHTLTSMPRAPVHRYDARGRRSHSCACLGGSLAHERARASKKSASRRSSISVAAPRVARPQPRHRSLHLRELGDGDRASRRNRQPSSHRYGRARHVRSCRPELRRRGKKIKKRTPPRLMCQMSMMIPPAGGLPPRRQRGPAPASMSQPGIDSSPTRPPARLVSSGNAPDASMYRSRGTRAPSIPVRPLGGYRARQSSSSSDRRALSPDRTRRKRGSPSTGEHGFGGRNRRH